VKSTAGIVTTEIRVPGSIANLGPGFDALSVAVQLYLRLRVIAIRPSEPDTIDWEFAGQAPSGENRIETAFRLARSRRAIPAPGLRVHVASDIPQIAGLGSSAAATIAGLKLYEAVVSGAKATSVGSGFSRTNSRTDDLLAMATELEGHPDNAAAALLGGLTVSCQLENGHIVARSWRWPDALRLVVATPDVPLQTSHARRVLPADLTMRDAVFNLQRALLLIHALDSGQYEDLRDAMRDRWHQPARAPLVPGLTEALAIDDPAVLGICLSGAGPSIVALASGGAARAATLLRALYDRLGVTCTIRTLSAHHAES
jgi:homoserine kinase